MLTFFPDHHNSDVAQDFEMFRHSGLGDTQCLHEFAHTHLTALIRSIAQQAHNVASSGVGQRIKKVCHNPVAYKEPVGSTMAGDCLRFRWEEGLAGAIVA